MERFLGIDLGDVRTGVAVSDPSGLLASGLATLHGLNSYELTQRIQELAAQYKIQTVVMGIPVNMDGSQGFRAEKVRAFGDALAEKTGLRVIYVDERLTTMQASRYLNAADVRGKKRKDTIDTLSAQIILQDYLDARRHSLE